MHHTKKILVLSGLALIIFSAILWIRMERRTPGEIEGESESIGEVIPVGANLIHINKDGFSPNAVKIKRGDTVTWTNEDSAYRWPASNIHPTHHVYPEFDPQKPIAPGESWSFTFEKAGIWFFHDHLRPRDLGKVVVEE